ncbi:hypothetical protein C8Q80DRAFT_254561 [Daedaleopsis nitida]|nr:hypothetical protein C8Q80DRAFT_254561 [Daedaleopsis nitida]
MLHVSFRARTNPHWPPFCYATVGLLQFVLLFVLNAMHIVFSLTGIFCSIQSNLNLFTDPLTAIIISRLFLDLQEVELQTVEVDSRGVLHRVYTSDGNSLSTLTFSPEAPSANAAPTEVDGREPRTTVSLPVTV